MLKLAILMTSTTPGSFHIFIVVLNFAMSHVDTPSTLSEHSLALSLSTSKFMHICLCRRLLSVIFYRHNMFKYLCMFILVEYNNYYSFKYYNNINAPTYPQICLLYKEYSYKRTLTHV